MDQSACRQHLGQLITEETDGLSQLAVLLEHEHELLVANDVTALESAIGERQRCVGKIIRVDEERRTLCRMHGYEIDAHGIEALMRWCDPHNTLGARWAECAARTGKCRELNDRNGALVSARLKRVQALLGVLIGGSQQSATYGKGGAYQLGNVGRVVATEA